METNEMKPKDIPLGALIDSLNDVREKRRALAAEDKKLVAEFESLEEQIKARLSAEGMDKATGKKASVSLSHTTVATVKDWDAVCQFVKKTGHFQLFQRRISDPAFREIIALPKMKSGIPGLESFDKISINLRNVES
jgi:hypothetical protein